MWNGRILYKEILVSRSDEIIQAYATNTWLIGLLTEGLSQAESLLQPPFPTNCVNWILGHILVSRTESIQLCGGELWNATLINRYKSDSRPVQDGDDDILHFDDLHKDLRASQQTLSSLLSELSDEEHNQVVETARGEKPRWQHIRGLHWHETYHMGQLELLRSFILSLRETEE
jgi:hypothetical protein